MGENQENFEVKLKKPTTFQEQIELLKSRNLVIDNEMMAYKILSNTNYYRFTGYGLHLNENDRFKDGTTFEFIYKIYEFDKKIRHLIMGALGTIEISFRTYIAYTLAHKCGAVGYLDKLNFKNEKYHERFIRELEREEYKHNNSELFIKHHIDNYGGQLPIWVATEIMSFGMLSMLYMNLKTEDKSKLANKYIGVNYNLVVSWIKSLADLRNTCAHYVRIYNKNFKLTPIIHKKYSSHNLDLDKLFVRILVIKDMIPYEEEWIEFYESLKELIEKYKEYIDLSLIGFPDNWNEILDQ